MEIKERGERGLGMKENETRENRNKDMEEEKKKHVGGPAHYRLPSCVGCTTCCLRCQTRIAHL
jgi:NAD-dependent dihydropyrimidine dehydrogenase PreA subunit